MPKVPSMKVMLASGYYDFATPFRPRIIRSTDAAERRVRKNITHEYYEGGHMMYLNEPSLAKLKRDLAGFYERALAR